MVGLTSAAQLDISTTTGHLGRNGNAPDISGLGDYPRLLLIIFGVEDINLNAPLAQCICQILRFGDILRAHQDGLPRGVDGCDFFHDSGRFILDRRKDTVLFIKPLQRLIAVNNRDVQTVELAQLIGCLHRGARHPAHQWVAPHKFLQGDGIENAPTFRDFQAFLGLYRRLQAIGPALQVGNAAPRGIDKLQLAVNHNVVNVSDKQRFGMQGKVNLHQNGADILLGIERINAQFLLHTARTIFGQLNGAAVLRDDVVQLFAQVGNHIGDMSGGCFARSVSGKYQRHKGLIYQDGVGFVHQGNIPGGLHGVGTVSDLVIAQQVEA